MQKQRMSAFVPPLRHLQPAAYLSCSDSSLIQSERWSSGINRTKKKHNKNNNRALYLYSDDMKAISPVRSLRKNNGNFSDLGISRSKTPVDDPLSLLYNMNDCYSKLKELVPSIPQNKSVSRMEILQHVIDYILDLQIALDSSVVLSRTRTPLTTLNTDISILSLQSPELPSELTADDRRTLHR